MGVRLNGGFTEPRTIVLGEGVTMTVRPYGYAEMKAIERAAFRMAQDRLEDAGRAADRTVLAGEDAEAYRDELSGLEAEILLDALVAKLADGWAGVEDEDGAPLTLTQANWRRFRAAYPHLAERAAMGIKYPAQMLDREGNASAPSSSGD